MRRFILLAAIASFSFAASAAPATDATKPAPAPVATAPVPSLAPVKPQAPVAATTTPAPAVASAQVPTVDLNFAKAEELQNLAGIGPARAKAIIDNRPYGTPQDLVSKASLPQSTVDALKGKIATYPANINTANVADIADRLPGIGAVRAAAIVKGRPYKKPEDLVSKGIITQSIYDGLKGLATVR